MFSLPHERTLCAFRTFYRGFPHLQFRANFPIKKRGVNFCFFNSNETIKRELDDDDNKIPRRGAGVGREGRASEVRNISGLGIGA